MTSEHSAHHPADVRHVLGGVTSRLLADGLGNDDIGQRLQISPETVRTYIRKAMDKLDADTRTQAVATALRQSLIA